MRIAMAPVRQTSEDLEAVFREYAPMIYRTARMVTGSPEDAEDIVQTIFLRLLRGEYTSKLQGNPRGYLHQPVSSDRDSRLSVNNCPGRVLVVHED